MQIEEMHKLFRALGQQMGMQQVRAILPATIDTYINTVINYKVRNLLFENTNIDFESRMVVRREEIIPINAFRSLYTEDEVSISSQYTFNIPNNLMMLLGIGIVYGGETKRYGCRLIDNIELENSLNDYCNGPYKEHPVANLYGNKIRMYFGNYAPNNYNAYIKYIKYPAIVKLSEDPNIPSVSCDLPEYMHTELVESAVKKFFEALGYTTPKNNEQNQN